MTVFVPVCLFFIELQLVSMGIMVIKEIMLKVKLIMVLLLTLWASGEGGGVENDPHHGFSSAVFARGMISKRNIG